ncbi:MAG: hypothetical protein IK077_01945 [Thermoguttaceae bacterium]|nr:hypothetical protein [Thermoguttaceae bacterium]
MPRRSQSSEETFTLFPFLAVLLCTMGTLTMIFVAVAQKNADVAETPESVAENSVEFDREIALGETARYGTLVDAKTLDGQVESDVPEPDGNNQDDAYERALVATGARSLEELIGEKESADWFAEELRSIRERVENSFEENRSRLATAEASLARLRAELETSKRKYEALQEESVAQDGETAVALQDRINALDVDIELLKKEIEELREKNRDSKRSYAIVPYQGKKGTFRRPIYIECTESGVYLQPEGVRFDDADFLVSKYPGNPFDSALRATARHYLETTGGKTASGEKIEAYPLLIVRPGGSKYFYEAVAALASWGDLYGYEFVAEDQILEYPESDPTLKRLASEQADLARRRLALQLRQALVALRATSGESGFGARGGGFGAGQDSYGIGSGGSELQSRLGTNVRLGAARPEFGGSVGGGGAPAGSYDEDRSNVQDGLVQEGSGVYAGRENANLFVATAPGADSRYDSTEPTSRLNRGGDELSTLSGDFNAERNAGTALQGTDVARVDGGSLATRTVGGGAYGGEQSSSSASRSNEGFAENRNALSGAQVESQTQYVENAAASGNAPRFMANLIGSDETQSQNESSMDARQALGRTAYAQGAAGTSDVGELSKSRSSDDEESDDAGTTASAVPNFLSSAQPEAIRLSQEKPATSGIERAVLARCEPGAIVFPKQPGVKKSTTIACRDATASDKREQELLDAFTFCVKSWKLAGRNAYWAPYVKAEVVEGGEEQFRELSAFCKRQGLSIVRVETGSPVK